MAINGFQKKNEDNRFRYLCARASAINSFLWKVDYYQNFAGSRNFLWSYELANQLLLANLPVNHLICYWASIELIFSMANIVVLDYHLPLVTTTYLYSNAMSNF